jgi:two-component system, LuxR family, sensor kinase FixL
MPLHYEKLLDALFQTAVDGMIVIDSRGIMKLVNPAVLALFGYAEAELIGQNVSILMPPKDSSQHDKYMHNYMRTGEKKIIGIGREVLGKKKDGSVFPFRLAVSQVQKEGEPCFAGIIHDITKQKAAEAEILQLNSKLEARIHERTERLAQVVNQLLETNEALQTEIADRKYAEDALRKSQQEVENALMSERELSELKSRFISTASHEFRTPLSTILSSTALIERYASKSDQYQQQQKHIQRIKLSVNNLTGILNDFLSLSRLEEGKVSANLSTFNFAELVNEVIEEMEVYAKAEQKIEYTDEDDAKFSEVYLDRHFLKNILINLTSNALKYSDIGKTVHIKSYTCSSYVHISISDEGMGIPESEQEHLFERFFRAQNATNIQGTGLGLNIVQRYVQLMQGQITFKSQLNEGTTFFIKIPLAVSGETNSDH